MSPSTTVEFTASDAAVLTDLLRTIEHEQATVSAAQARLTRALARADALAERQAAGAPAAVRERDMARRSIAAEIAVPLHLSDRAVQRQMSDASALVDDYPATLDAWEAGRITRGHVFAVVDAGGALPPDRRHAFDERAVPACEAETVGRVRVGLQILAARMHPRTLTERHVDAREGRRVTLSPLGDGMARIVADVPLVLGEGIHDRLTRQAIALVDERERARTRIREARAAGLPDEDLDEGDVALASDTRTREHLRADILTDMLLTSQVSADPTRAERADGNGDLGAIRAHVQVVVPAATLLGDDENPAELVGAAPVDAVTARSLAGNCPGVDRILTHPVSGQVLATDRYTPTNDLRRRLRARDRHCRFPGCRIPALRCEHDHTVDHSRGGPTRLENLAGLCQRHHSMKQFAPWRVRQLGGGVLEWTSPLGRVYSDRPPPAVVFRDDASAEHPPPRDAETAPPF
ncbi:DUF222 domain-containing protein [Microbacterium sp. NPDC089189]|uniref:HNH endonuclease signature motif containing protein n=1 Tax=Microbacterium sp. NPDC089189 TaxID=3154972 RepID=UPI003440E3E7